MHSNAWADYIIVERVPVLGGDFLECVCTVCRSMLKSNTRLEFY